MPLEQRFSRLGNWKLPESLARVQVNLAATPSFELRARTGASLEVAVARDLSELCRVLGAAICTPAKWKPERFRCQKAVLFVAVLSQMISHGPGSNQCALFFLGCNHKNGLAASDCPQSPERFARQTFHLVCWRKTLHACTGKWPDERGERGLRKNHQKCCRRTKKSRGQEG